MKKISVLHILMFLFLTCISIAACAQENDVEMADVMRSNGKIYVVVAVLSVILAGLFIFLIRIDRTVSRIENKSMQE